MRKVFIKHLELGKVLFGNNKNGFSLFINEHLFRKMLDK